MRAIDRANLQAEYPEKFGYKGSMPLRQWKLIEDRTWNGEKVIEHFIGDWDQCLIWVLKHTPFSLFEAITNQGYKMLDAKTGEEYKL